MKIFGANLAPEGLVTTPTPYPVTLNGTSVTFTHANGNPVIIARMVYTTAGQVVGQLPSNAPTGTYAVRVIRSGGPGPPATSPPFNVTVVARSFRIATVDSSGSGPAQATIGNINGGLSLVRFTTGSVTFGGFTWTLTPARAGDTLVAWGTGGGADAANDTGGSSGDQAAAGGFAVLVNGREIVPLYAGTSQGFPGLWQINFALPPDIAPDCFATLQVRAGGDLGNTTTIAIAPPGRAACEDPNNPPSVLAKLDSGRNIVGGSFAMARALDGNSSNLFEFASGGVFVWTPAQWIAGAPLRGRTGRCLTYDRTIPAGGVDPANPGGLLDAGARLPLDRSGDRREHGARRNCRPDRAHLHDRDALVHRWEFVHAFGSWRP